MQSALSISTPRFSHVPWCLTLTREDMLLALGSVRACRVPTVQMVMHDPRKWWPSRIWPKVLPSGYFPEFRLESSLSLRVVNTGGIPKYFAIIAYRDQSSLRNRPKRLNLGKAFFARSKTFPALGSRIKIKKIVQ